MSLYILSDPYGADTEQLHSDRCDDDTMALVCKQGTPLGKHGAHVLPEFDVEKAANLPTTVDLSLYTTAECSVDEMLESEASGRETSELHNCSFWVTSEHPRCGVTRTKPCSLAWYGMNYSRCGFPFATGRTVRRCQTGMPDPSSTKTAI